MRYSLVPVVIFSSLSLVACGGDDDDDTVDPVVDASTADGSSGDAAVASCRLVEDYGELGELAGAQGEYTVDSDVSDGDDSYAGIFSLLGAPPAAEGDPVDALFVDLYKTYPPFDTATLPITNLVVPLTGDQLAFSSCGLCIQALGDATVDIPGQPYFASGGSATVSISSWAVGATVSLTLSGLTLREIDPDAEDTTPVAGGCTTAIDGATFEGTLAAPSSGRAQRVRLTRRR